MKNLLLALLLLTTFACQAKLDVTLEDVLPSTDGPSCIEGERLCREDSSIYQCQGGTMVKATSCPTLGCFQDGLDASCNAPSSITVSDLCPSTKEPFCEEVTGTIWQCEDYYVTAVEHCKNGCDEMAPSCR